MRTVLLCLLLCIASGGCVSSAGHCHGPLQPINAAPQPKTAQGPSSADPRTSIP